VLPVLQFDVADAFCDTVLMTQVLLAAPLCEELGTGSGGPKRQPAFVQMRKEHLALLQDPTVHTPPGVQSALVVHGEAQSPLAVQAPRNFSNAPCVHRLLPASAGVVPVNVSVEPTHDVTLVTEVPKSGTSVGSGTATPAPPK